MVAASALVPVCPGVVRWAAFSPEHRVELAAHAVEVKGCWWVFDPIPLVLAGEPNVLPGRVGAVVLTNGNHARASRQWCDRHGVEPWSWDPAAIELHGSRGVAAERLEGWEVQGLAGGAPGESVWWCPAHSLAVFGDAVVNLPGRGLERLPDRYCLDPAQLERSLGQWLAGREFDRAVLAHGDPLVGGAAARIRTALGWGAGSHSGSQH